MEIGETGSMVNDPQKIKLEAGEKFPENTNQNRIWVNQRNLSKPSVQG
ncbi:YjzC family protein [Oceanobacillus sp. 143]|nr:YjzC family protein [Oceanobacillus sp. 143]